MDKGPVPVGAAQLAPAAFDAPHGRGMRDVWYDVKSGLDFIAHNLPRWHRVLSRLNPYPKPWETIEVPAFEGARLSACYGPGRPGGPAILFAPGTFQTKDDTPRKRRAIDLWRRFGAHVLIVDLRGFGGSHAHLGTAGYLESRDLHAAADWLRARSGASRVILWGESLGAASSLLAACLPDAETRFERVIAWSPFADFEHAARVASPDTDVGRSLVGRTYRWLLRLRLDKGVRDFDQYLTERAASLGLDREGLAHHASPRRHVSALRVPVFVYHAEDDAIVSVDQARILQDAIPESQHLNVEIVPRGAHLDFDRAAPAWYAAVTARHLAGGTD